MRSRLARAADMRVDAALLPPALDWESLVMPGPVISGHAEIEKDCRKCHVPFARDEQRGLCLDCHDKVAADISRQEGLSLAIRAGAERRVPELPHRPRRPRRRRRAADAADFQSCLDGFPPGKCPQECLLQRLPQAEGKASRRAVCLHRLPCRAATSTRRHWARSAATVTTWCPGRKSSSITPGQPTRRTR